MEEEKPKKFKFKLWDSKSDRRLLKYVFVVILLTASLITIKDEIIWYLSDYEYSETEDKQNFECNVLGLELRGNIVTYLIEDDVDATASENIVFSILNANDDDEIKAVILEIDSYGGHPVASEEIARAIKWLDKPVIAFVREGAVSGGYLAASGADIIFASKNSDIGGIGVTASYLDNTVKNQREGINYISLASAKFKDSGDPNKPLTLEERNLFMRDVNILHDNFVESVAEGRGLEINQIKRLADGSTFLGKMALDNGLIDRIGDYFDVKNYLRELIGEEISVCWE